MPLAPYRAPMYDYGPTSRMSDLIRLRGEVAAQGELRNAGIRTQMARDVAGIANATMADLARASVLKKAEERQARLDKQDEFDRAQQRQVRDLQIKNTDAEMAGRAAQQREQGLIQSALQQFTVKGDDGTVRIDWDKVEGGLVANNAAHLVPEIRKQRADLEKIGQQIQLTKTQAYAKTAVALEQMGGDKDVVSFALGLGTLRDAGVITDAEMREIYQQVEDAAQGDPEKAAAEIQRLVTVAKVAGGVKPEKPEAPVIRSAGRSVVAVNPAGTTATVLYTDPVVKSGGDDSDAPKPSTIRTAQSAYERTLADINADATVALSDPTLRAEQRAAIQRAADERRRGAKRAYDAAIGRAPGVSASGMATARVTASSDAPTDQMQRGQPAPAQAQPAPLPSQTQPQMMTRAEAQRIATLTGRTLAEVEAQAVRDGITIR